MSVNIQDLHITPAIETALAGLEPVSLKGLDKVKLMNRVDSKYVFHVRELSSILLEIAPHYTVLEIDGKRVFDYVSLYFDTPEYDLYRHHHSGRANRVKLRYRQYVDTGDIFFEVKKKVKGIRTDKYRVRQPEITPHITPEAAALMEKLGVAEGGMVGKTWINYRRITLAANESEERVTLDLGLEFISEHGSKSFPEIAIAEIKQSRSSRQSPMIQALAARRLGQFRISKYSLAVALLVPDIKNNAFKGKMNRIFKIVNA